MAKLPPQAKVTTPKKVNKRGTTAERGYGWEWQKIREQIIRERVFCEVCRNQWAEEVHHKDRNTFNNDPANLTAICRRCHQKEHRG